MRALNLLLLTAALHGCGSVTREPPIGDARQTDADEQNAQLIHSHQQTLSISKLMLQRQELCQISGPDRRRLLDDYQAIFIAAQAEPVSLETLLPKRKHQLNALMLATCNPAKTPGLLSEMLSVVTAEDDWPGEYMAFFDLLVAGHKAYAVLRDKQGNLAEENRNLKSDYEVLRADYERLQTEHEKTIKGISEIERSIDIPDAENSGARP